MSLACPHCGGEIVGFVVGTAPLPGWRPGSTGVSSESQPGSQLTSQSGPQARIEHGFEVQGLSPSPKKKRAYNQDYNAYFTEFWAVYPRHQDKRKAAQSHRNAIARLVSTGVAIVDARASLINGAIRYRDDPNRLPEFTKLAATWLNADAWEDDPLPTRLNGKEPVKVDVTEDDYRRISEEVRRETERRRG